MFLKIPKLLWVLNPSCYLLKWGVRTDPYGRASLENLSPDDKYYVIGIDKDVDTNVVTIWSKEVEVAPGENLVELTSTDVIYQE